MATLQNERDKTLQATNPRLVATTVVISGTSALFTKPNPTDPITPATITLTGVTTVFTSPTIKWYYASNADMVWHDYNISGNNIGASRLLTSADFITQLGASGTKVLYKATAEQTGFTSSESLVFEVTYEDLSATGVDGEDAYHIRLDNESRFVLFEYTGNAKQGQLPVTAQAYITKGASDVTVGSGYITYSINSVSGATGASINSSGVITVNGITLDTNYVEIKAVIAEPSLPTLNAYKKLYIYKTVEASLKANVDVTQNHAYYEYADATSTTNIAAWSSITFTATVLGYPDGIVTWSAETYDSAGQEIAGSETIFTATGNTCTVSAAQFIARGGNTVDELHVTATYKIGNSTVSDFGVIYRRDGTNGSRFLYTDNNNLTFTPETDGSILASELASDIARLQVIDLSTDAPVDDTIGWSFTATPSAGITVSLDGTGAGPYVATASPVVLSVTAITAGTLTGSITVVATKAGQSNVQRTITVEVGEIVTAGYELVVDPDKTIILPVDESSNITGYASAIRDIWVRNGTIDDSANWTITKQDGPGVTSTYSNGVLSVTNFVAASTTIVFELYGTNTFTGTILNINNNSNFAHNNNGTFVVQIISTAGGGNSINSPPIMLYSNDYGATWTKSSSVAVPPATYASNTGFGYKLLCYSEQQNKFAYIYYVPDTGGNGRVIYSDTGATWSLSGALPNLSGSEVYGHGDIIADSATNKVYITSVAGTVIFHTTDFTTWTTVNTGITANSGYHMSVYNGQFIKANSAEQALTGYSSNMTSWTNNNDPNVGNSDWSNRSIYNSKDFYYMPNYDGSGTSKGFSCRLYSNTNWKNFNLNTPLGGVYPHIFRDGNSIYLSSHTVAITNPKIYVTKDAGSTFSLCSVSGTNTATNGISNMNVTGQLGQNVISQGGSKYLPVVNIVGGSPNTINYYRGLITEGNNGSESYITVTATSNNPELGSLTQTVIVKKGAYTGDVYALVVNPGTIQLPSTSDGKVYPSSFTNNTNVSTYTVLKNGITYTGGITGNITASTGVTAAVTGNGTNTGTVTVSAMTDAAASGTITGTVSIDGVIGTTLNVTIKVVKLRDGITSGIVSGATVSAFSAADTSIYVRFNSTGTIEIKRGAGSYVYALDWYKPTSSSSPPGSGFYINMGYTSDTGDTLQNGTNGTQGTWSQLNVNREWHLTNAATGTHRVTLNVKIGTSNTGANAVIGSGILELQVP
jgi:hypothetical protein